MKRKLLQSSLALTAAAALGLGGAFAASPAMAADQAPAETKQAAETEQAPKALNVQSDAQVQKALSDVGGVNAYGEEGGKLYLGVEKKTSEIKDLEKKYDNVVVETGVDEVKAQASNDLVGGAGYLVGAGKSGGACSTGFSGWDGDGNPIVLTAGHCAKIINMKTNKFEGSTKVSQTEQPSTAPAVGGEGFKPSGDGVIGKWGFNNFGGTLVPKGDKTSQPKSTDIDFAVIKVNADNYTNKKGVTDWKTAKGNDLAASTSKITSVGKEKVGSTIHKSGRTTGVTSGTVSKKYAKYKWQVVSGRWVHGFAVTAPIAKPFSAPGDSGGGVYQGTTAVGVISGGGDLDKKTSFTWVADLDYSLQKSGIDFNINEPSDETPKAPKAPGVDDQTIKPNGDVKGTAAPGSDVKVKWEPASGAQAAKADSKTVKADKNGDFKLEGPKAEGKYDYSAVAVVDGQESRDTDFTVTVKKEKTETPAPVKREISIDPKEIVASDFVKKDKAVTITVKGFDEGEKVTLKIASGPKNVEGITLKQTAKKDGVAAFAIYGTSASNPEAYLGNYDVSVTGANDTDDEKALTGSFKVVADEDGNGGGDNGDGGDGGSDLPRTGTELTGLAAGAGLLVIGGAAVVLTMRRKKN
ncbi:LPXTG cell wall anchor domain-containing protein [Brevibacterium sp. ZH18]|uniref:LPXTG cell wall anchor domain-containing protein n=1 Tax=Brevibacterium sp. ZH18 TaxID=2927784 RepID=UPI001F61EC2F|nr:LPXTG cell wall anchor domain-containing protein [Brevibacterium sp. ZH18]MCI4011621.1 LPXTG cell wall anchor domain-containing protein [Brevibacterium sp. ZH18]